MYKSPINVIFDDVCLTLEEEIFKAVQDVKIEVNKTQLIEALRYDRDQYEKGYTDALKELSEELKTRAQRGGKNDSSHYMR